MAMKDHLSEAVVPSCMMSSFLASPVPVLPPISLASMTSFEELRLQVESTMAAMAPNAQRVESVGIRGLPPHSLRRERLLAIIHEALKIVEDDVGPGDSSLFNNNNDTGDDHYYEQESAGEDDRAPLQ